MLLRHRYVLSLIFFVVQARTFAQGLSPGASSSGPQALTLPLSGRSAPSGSVTSVQTPIPGVTTSINTINTNVQVQGTYGGSVAGQQPLTGVLTMQEAVRRGLAYNLGTTGATNAVEQVRGQVRVVRSALLPNLNGALRENVQQTNLKALGLRVNLPFPGFNFPTIVGPFNYYDLRATLNQNLADFTALNNYRAAKEGLRAAELFAQDARDLVVYAVAGTYLQVTAAKARLKAAAAQVSTAEALFHQSEQRRGVGLIAQLDVNRSQLELQMQRQRLTSLENDLAKQKINLARVVGLEIAASFDVAEDVPFSAIPEVSLPDAVKQALETRADLKAADAQIRAAERARAAARAERLPSLAITADYGAIGTNPAQSHGTFTFVGSLRFPIWQGGRTEGAIQEAEATVNQRRAEMSDLRGRIEGEVNNAFLDVRSAASQVEVARSNQTVTRQNLDLTRQRFDAGIADSVEVVQAQEAVAAADLDYITGVFAYNVAKLGVARSLGNAEQNLFRYFQIP